MNKPKLMYVKRYPFRRYSLMRELVSAETRHLCDWCGSRSGKFRYWMSPDSVRDRDYPTDGEFCSVDCWRAYYQEEI